MVDHQLKSLKICNLFQRAKYWSRSRGKRGDEDRMTSEGGVSKEGSGLWHRERVGARKHKKP